MNKKIKIIDLLNLIANKEEIPRHIKYKYYQYDWSDNANNYICEDADGKRLSMFDDGYICILCNSLNNEVEILEDNTEEIEEINTSYIVCENDFKDGNIVKILNEFFEKNYRQTERLRKAVNKLRKDKSND